jgi:protein TonB
VHLIQARLVVALSFSTAAHVGLAWMVDGQLASNAAPAQRALTVSMTPAAPRAVLNSIAPTATAAQSPQVVRPLAPPAVAAIQEPDAVLAVRAAVLVESVQAPLVQARAAEHQLLARDANAFVVAVAAAPAARKNTPAPRAPASAAASPARAAVAGERGSGVHAGSPQAVAGQPGANRQAQPASGNEPPRYPWTARARGQQGRVVLSVWVSAEGEADQLAVLHSSGHGALDRAALEAVQQWRFQPARRAGLETGSLIYVPVVFRLDDGG